MAGCTPAIDSIADDLVHPLLLALSATLVSLGPLILLMFLAPEAISISASSPVVTLLFVAGLVWALFYFPVALIVASEGGSCADTLNPLHGFRFVERMGGIYWQTLVLFLVIAAAHGTLLFVLHRIPSPLFVRIVGSFVTSYAFLCTCCALGFAILKKAPEMGLE
jgi:hypothetical protein